MTVVHILPTYKIRSVEISTLLAIYWCGIKARLILAKCKRLDVHWLALAGTI